MAKREACQQVSLSLPRSLIAKLDEAANARDVGRRWLIERLLVDGVERLVPVEELRLTHSVSTPPVCEHRRRYCYHRSVHSGGDRWRCGDCGQELAEISTRRVEAGVVHEMADLGVGTMCGLDLAEPWEWTDEPVTCALCGV